MNDIMIGGFTAVGGTFIIAGITIFQLTLNHKREQTINKWSNKLSSIL